ncbi:hypothetical protein [Candidatus Tisiphia endosymbiont of Beris chalybata]|uniref:hypothetical protein n=1 Tax=Candidatus Tisiphia endosymbiont of Beris chalybata TaxID=3066262 RepID=UPI00312CAFC6
MPESETKNDKSQFTEEEIKDLNKAVILSMVRKTLEEHNTDTNKPKDINVNGYQDFLLLIDKQDRLATNQELKEESNKNSDTPEKGKINSGAKIKRKIDALEKYNSGKSDSTDIEVLKKALKLKNPRLFEVNQKYEKNSNKNAKVFQVLMRDNPKLKNIEKIAQTKNPEQFKEEKEKVEKKFKELIQNPKMQKVIKSGEFIQVVRTLGEVAPETIAKLTMPEQEIKSLAKAVVDKMRKVMEEKHPKVTNLPNVLPPPVSQSSAKRPGSERGGR